MIEHFDKQAFEREIVELSKQVEQAAHPEAQKEAIRTVIAEKLYPAGNEGTQSPASTSAQTPQTGALPAYAASAPAEVRLKVEQLLNEAMHKGIMHSIAQVKKSDPLVMDLFHDAITERLYTEFKKRGIIR